ncbi:MAG: hypothetical protein H7276_01780 [Caulobacter sp.]|nr:hypothetical protein [Vitreoscilla sp.]
MTSLRTLLALVSAGLLLGGCVVVPVVREDGYDPGCQVWTRHMELQAVQLGMINGCNGPGCQAMVLVNLGVTAASAVISGSIVVVGNMAYWAERRVNCVPPGAPPAPLG